MTQPDSFMEQIQARKTNGFWDRNIAKYASKTGAKSLATELDIATPATYAITDNPNDLPRLREAVYKSNRGYSGKRVVAYRDGTDLLHRDSIDWPGIVSRITSPEQGECGRFIAEELVTYQRQLADELKVMSFAGVNCCVWFKETSRRESAWYSLDWHRVPTLFDVLGYTDSSHNHPRPAQLDLALDWASRITSHLATFARVDFLIGDDLMLGEITYTPAGGQSYTPWGEDLLSVYWNHFIQA